MNKRSASKTTEPASVAATCSHGLLVWLLDHVTNADCGKYRSNVVPSIGDIIDTKKRSFRVLDVQHDVCGDIMGDTAHQSTVIVYVEPRGK